MDWTHLHLALNHLPVVGIPLFLLVLIIGCWRRSRDILKLALWAIFLLSAVAIPIKFTGDFAAEKDATRLKPVETYVSHHEQAADQATTGVFLLALASAAALFLARGQRPLPSWATILVLVLGLATVALYIRTAQSGGRIGHPELRDK